MLQLPLWLPNRLRLYSVIITIVESGSPFLWLSTIPGIPCSRKRASDLGPESQADAKLYAQQNRAGSSKKRHEEGLGRSWQQSSGIWPVWQLCWSPVLADWGILFAFGSCNISHKSSMDEESATICSLKLRHKGLPVAILTSGAFAGAFAFAGAGAVDVIFAGASGGARAGAGDNAECGAGAVLGSACGQQAVAACE